MKIDLLPFAYERGKVLFLGVARLVILDGEQIPRVEICFLEAVGRRSVTLQNLAAAIASMAELIEFFKEIGKADRTLFPSPIISDTVQGIEMPH